MKNQVLLLLALVLLSACNDSSKPNTTKQPTITDYQLGEKWVWKYKGVTVRFPLNATAIE